MGGPPRDQTAWYLPTEMVFISELLEFSLTLVPRANRPSCHSQPLMGAQHDFAPVINPMSATSRHPHEKMTTLFFLLLSFSTSLAVTLEEATELCSMFPDMESQPGLFNVTGVNLNFPSALTHPSLRELIAHRILLPLLAAPSWIGLHFPSSPLIVLISLVLVQT